jgi:hypothetical protein
LYETRITYGNENQFQSEPQNEANKHPGIRGIQQIRGICTIVSLRFSQKVMEFNWIQGMQKNQKNQENQKNQKNQIKSD